MVNYQCYRCGYTNYDKTKINIHLRRKFTCNPIYNNINLDECSSYILEGKTFEEYKIYLEKAIFKPKSSLNEVKSKPVNVNIHECVYCNKTYAHNQSLYKHLKICKEKKKDDEVKDSMAELVKMLNEQLQDKNVQIIDFKKELSKQNKELMKRNKQLEELIKKAGTTASSLTINNSF